MRLHIPFNKPLYLKTLGVVAVVIVLLFVVAIICFDYEPTTADPFGAPVAAVLAAYFFHLAFWNPET
ncbi:MAG: hypothetical protein SH857_01980 [Chitinophagales bacterium]|nr:hypothetical protein [Chitinophagales bacterium]